MSEELQAHLEALIERNIAAGMSPDDARQAALRTFGGVAQIEERARDERRNVWLEQAWQDLRYAIRGLARTPSFTITAVLTLALGIGVNAALFSVFNMIALRSLPLKDPDNLVQISGTDTEGRSDRGFSYAEYLAYRDGNRSLDGLLAFTGANWILRQDAGSGTAMRGFEGRWLGTVRVDLVSENYFDVLGGRIARGRGFLSDEFIPGAAPVIVLSHAFWERHLQSDPNVLGTTLMLDRRAVTVIGVTSDEFVGPAPAPPAGWLPLGVGDKLSGDFGSGGRAASGLIGRLKPGISEAQAKADLDTIAARLAAEFPSANAKTAVELKRGLRFVNIPRTLLTAAQLSPLFLGFGMVLVIACTNVANLLLARGVSRQAEIGVRLTLGASRGRIIRQLLAENVLLCLLGAVVGLALGTWTLQLLQPIILAPFMPAVWFMFLKPVPDLHVLGFTALLTLGATLVAGLLPAWHAVRANLMAAMRNDGTAFGRRLTPSRLRQVLVISQVAVCLMLLSCAGVMARNFFALRDVDVGFDANAVFRVDLMPNPAIADRNAAFPQALESVRAVPGVAATAAVYGPPLGGGGARPLIRAEAGSAIDATEAEVPASFVTSDFFQTFGIPLLRGRDFRELELHSAARSIVVSESLARELWPAQAAVGKTLAVSETAWASRERAAPEGAFRECEVIGVARDITKRWGDDDRRAIYLPMALDVAIQAPVFVRPHGNSAAALVGIMQGAQDGGVELRFEGPLSSVLEQYVGPYLGLAGLSGALGMLALALASVGLFGLMTFVVSQRVREIGIRMALGATAKGVVALFVRQGMRLVTIGLAAGLIGGGMFALLLNTILYGIIDAFDPIAFAGVTLLFALLALFACWIPALRATKVDPVVALRAE